ncbi:MAG TPA: M28 family metallopeptidase [Vicinamibacterales bacterium]
MSALGVPRLRAAAPDGFKSDLLPSQHEIWDQQKWMAQLGPKYTGNKAHTEFVDFLARSMTSFGLEVQRDRYTLPRWEVGPGDRVRLERVEAAGEGGGSKPSGSFPISSYFPYSGETSTSGVTGELVYAGTHPKPDLSAVNGRIALVDFAVNARDWSHLYTPWAIHPAGESFPSVVRPARAAISDLTPFHKAGAIGVVIAWTDVSDENARDQYTPFSRPPQGIPGVYVDRSTGVKLREHAARRDTFTLTLTATVTPDTPTDTVIAVLPGAGDEVVILNTHTDGPNATEENGALGLLALAKYFSKIPKAQRRRTLVFPMTTGHFAGPWVPSIRGFIEKHPDLVKRAVAAVTVEHLGCREWLDVAPDHYAATGKNEWSVAITPNAGMAKALADSLDGSLDRAAVVNPVNGGFLGEGNSLSRAGIPTIGYIPQPNYLLAAPADACISKMSPELMHSQITVFAKLVHQINGLSAAELKG